MKLDNIYKITAVCAVAFSAMGCSDTWDEHYGEENRIVSNQSLLQLVEADGRLGDFLKVLKSTHVFSNNKPTSVTYADLLASDQTFTVWAPLDGTFNVDSLLQECQTVSGDSMCSQHFIQNHIAHYRFSTENASQQRIQMLNSKWLDWKSGKLGPVSTQGNGVETPAQNGILHLLSREVPYSYNIYEGVTSLPEFSGIGSFFKGYEKQELDEKASIQCGIEDGMKIYSDSVMRRYNILFYQFERIQDEDSTYIMLLPDAALWNQVSAEAKSYFNYGNVQKADSLQNYWAHVSLIRDLVYNRNVGCRSMKDSVWSTSYSPYDKERRHLYYEPLKSGGIFSSTYVKDSIDCSNGKIYRLHSWPFTAEQIYFYPVKVETENTTQILDYKDCTYSFREAAADSISEGYLDILQKTSSSNWTIDFRVPNVLSGTYDICAVILPKTVANPNSRDFKPNKFKAALTYETVDGEKKTEVFDTELKNDPHKVDTVVIGRFNIPVTSYAQTEAKVSLQIQCSIGRRETNYSREMLLDCLYFKPVRKEE